MRRDSVPIHLLFSKLQISKNINQHFLIFSAPPAY